MAGDIWEKVNLSLVEDPAPAEAGSADSKPAFGEWLERWARIRPFIDGLASLSWVYAFLKVFVFDVAQALLEWIAPGADWLVDFRALLLLGFSQLPR
jgi:hypothetical protein